MNFIISRWIEQ